ncbi:hypothetical protein AK812_SmicGene9862 [Symbiodinium microadriaticum]|uniref:Uncharacterized protein n=1 Tax=Symbiodinium microadriaticum TaxID=2951 RepID=A0A1Q9EH86_SYMMI|nr:hypothetical protein AK812_SmicGene9862 [Symbiodinium microadriaticum]
MESAMAPDVVENEDADRDAEEQDEVTQDFEDEGCRCDGVILTPEAPARRLRCKTPPEQAGCWLEAATYFYAYGRTPSQHQVSAKKVQKDGTSKELSLNQVLQLIWLFAFGQTHIKTPVPSS